MKEFHSFLGGLIFAFFIAGKLVSFWTFAAWSWWWLLLPFVPVVGELLIHYVR